MSDIQFEINTLEMSDFLKAAKYYYYTKQAQQKYGQTENGKQKIREARHRYYEKKRTDPEFMKNQAAKARERYHKKKDSLNNISFPNLI
jgi:hypothetical protein